MAAEVEYLVDVRSAPYWAASPTTRTRATRPGTSTTSACATGPALHEGLESLEAGWEGATASRACGRVAVAHVCRLNDGGRPLAEVSTIGAYGWNEQAFLDALLRARIATFCDVRQRRGVRGSEYAFVNSNRLQRRLADLGIRYVHRLDLAPTTEMRQAQYAADEAAGVGKRSRSELGQVFVDAYRRERLDDLDARGFLDEVATDGPVALFCVERDAAACHRGLIAAALTRAGAEVTHLTP